MAQAHAHGKRYGMAATNGQCVFTGLAGSDPAHLWPAGDFKEFADIPENIFAIVRDHHSVRGAPCFDFKQVDGIDIVRPISERIWMLLNMSLDEFRYIVKKKIYVMSLYCERHGVEFPEAEQPSDYYELISQKAIWKNEQAT